MFSEYLLDLTEKHGAQITAEVIKQADVFEEEIWMKRIGPTLWTYLNDAINEVISLKTRDYTDTSNYDKVLEKYYSFIPYFLHDISLMEPEGFIIFINNVVYKKTLAVEELCKMAVDIERYLDSEEVPDEISAPKEYAEMNLKELQTALEMAVKEERYEDASIINKIIKEACRLKIV